MRNNQDRLGATNRGQDAPIPQAHEQNENFPNPQTLQFVTPTEIIDLPSKGVYYPEEHPLHKKDTVEIRHMTAKDEDILTSRTLLQKGLAIDRFLQNIVVDRSIRIDELLIGDKNAIIVASRVTGYGAAYQVQVPCPSCNSSTEYVFDLNECNVTEFDNYAELGVRKTDNNTFVVYLEKSKVDVEVKLLTSKEEKKLITLMESRRKKKLPETNLTNQLRLMIVSVNGNSDHQYIESFIQHMPALDSKNLRSTYQQIIPNIDLTQDFVCPDCGHEGGVDVPFGATFFWPK